MVTLENRRHPLRRPPARWPWLLGLAAGLCCVLALLAAVNALLRLT
jgi:hypothetical protein